MHIPENETVDVLDEDATQLPRKNHYWRPKIVTLTSTVRSMATQIGTHIPVHAQHILKQCRNQVTERPWYHKYELSRPVVLNLGVATQIWAAGNIPEGS
jgi:hypothetical protein